MLKRVDWLYVHGEQGGESDSSESDSSGGSESKGHRQSNEQS